MAKKLTPATTGTSELACTITEAVLELDGFAPLWGNIASTADQATFAANVARVIDRELDNHWRSTQGATSARRSMVERLSEE